jgi:hypothetical protein
VAAAFFTNSLNGYTSTLDPEGVQVDRRIFECSLLARGFNQAWCTALSAEYDYFVMLHADIVPQPGWLEKLIELIETTSYRMISAVVPLKSPLGITSTGVGFLDNWYGIRKRLTMQEVFRLPETFDITHLYAAGILPPAENPAVEDVLLVNTGCFIANLTASYAFHTLDGDGALIHHFRIEDRVLVRSAQEVWKETRLRGVPMETIANSQDSRQQYLVETIPEDWGFSRTMAAYNIPYAATRAVRVNHLGTTSFHNFAPWGVEREFDPVPNQLVVAK